MNLQAQEVRKTNDNPSRLDDVGTNCRSNDNHPVLKQGKSVLNQTVKKILSPWEIIRGLQRVVRVHTGQKGVKTCSTFSVAKSNVMRVSSKGGNARLMGLNKCLNTTSCPTCSYIRGTQRARQIDLVAKPVIDAGGCGVLLTLTLPHLRKDNLRHLNKVLSECFHSLMRNSFGRAIGKFNDDNKPLWCRSWDWTWGRNGDHSHLHVLLLFQTKPDPVMMQILKSECFDKWCNLVEKKLGRTPSYQAYDWTPVYDVSGVANYNNKISSLAFEIAAGGIQKKSNGESLNIGELILAIEQEGDEERRKILIRKFKMYEKQTHKLRTISFSKSFKDKMKKEEEAQEDEIQEDDTNSKELFKIRSDLTKMIMRKGDLPSLYQVVNAYTLGDETTKDLFVKIVAITEKYSEDTMLFDDEQMSRDWDGVAWAMKAWTFYRHTPAYYHHKHSDLIGLSE